MAIMGNRNRIIYIVGLLLQLQGSSQIDKDENRPYEFSFTIDGEQHRYEKKDVQGIIQGEFGFITGDGIYHVTVYATDENGSFKILSMKNVRVSGPLDGSSYGDGKIIPQELVSKYINKPISPETKYSSKPFGVSETKYTNKPFGIPETKYTSKPFGIPETKYTNKPFGISETKYTSKSPFLFSSQNVNQYNSPTYTSTPRTTLFKLTTVSTIRPGCGGCGIIARTTPKTKLPQSPIQFSNNKANVAHAYPRPLSLPPPSSNPNYNSNSIYNNNEKPNVPNYFRPETYETTTKSALHYNYNFENHAQPQSAKPPIYSGNNYNDNTQTYETTTKSASHYNYNFDNHDKPELTKPPVTRGNNFNFNYETTKKSSLQSNYNFDQAKPQSTKPPVTNRGNSFNENNNYKPESYSTTTKPLLLSNNNFGNTLKPQSYGTTTRPTQFASNNFNYGSSSKAPFYTPTPTPDPYTNKNYGSSSKAPFYNPTATTAPFTSKIFETSTKREPNNYNAVQFNPIAPSKIDLQGNKDVVYPLPLQQKFPISAGIKTDKENIYIPGNNPIHMKDKYPNMKEGLPIGITESDIVGLLYKFNYTVGFHGHYEKGWNNGTKTGGYFVNGRDGYSRVVTYVADENGYRPKFRLIHLGYDSPDTPKADSEKKFGLKNFEFVWYPVN